jgi:D-alanyl-D-alanine carboxypeptidase (penicillin-binding protein 5/6)
LLAPLDAGQQVGRIRVELGDELVAGRDLVTLGSVTPSGFFSRAMDGMRLWFGGLFGDE